MKKITHLIIILMAVLLFPPFIRCEDDVEIHINKIDSLLESGMIENYQPSGVKLLKEALDICLSLVESHPNNYEVLWRCTRSCAQYTEAVFGLQAEQWKDICKTWGKRGMEFGKSAQKIESERVEAYYWQLKCIGSFARAAGIISILTEGLKGMSDHSMAKAYELDKSYLDYSPVFMRAMQNYECPRPFRDKKKAMEYYKEYNSNAKWQWESHIKYTSFAKLLTSLKKEEYTSEAKRLLELAISDPDPRPYYHEMATKMLEKVNNPNP